MNYLFIIDGNIYNNNPNIILALINENHYNFINKSDDYDIYKTSTNLNNNIENKETKNDDNTDLYNDYFYNLNEYYKNNHIKKII